MQQQFKNQDDGDIDPEAIEGVRLAIQSLLRYLPESRAVLGGYALMLSCFRGNVANSLLAMIPSQWWPSGEMVSTYRKKTEQMGKPSEMEETQQTKETGDMTGP